MRIFLFLFSLFGLVFVASAATDTPVMCTMEYAPVCGQPPMPECPAGMACIQVMPQRETYGNACMARAAGATDVVVGECASTPVVGGDSDMYGCKASAGYKWHPVAAKCIRPWESRVRVLTV